MVFIIDIMAIVLTVVFFICLLPFLKMLSFKGSQRGSSLSLMSYKRIFYTTYKNIFCEIDESVGFNLNTLILFLKLYASIYAVYIVPYSIFMSNSAISDNGLLIVGLLPLFVTFLTIINKSARYGAGYFFKSARVSTISLCHLLITLCTIGTIYFYTKSFDIGADRLSILEILINGDYLVGLAMITLMISYLFSFTMLYDEDLFKDSSNQRVKRVERNNSVRFFFHEIITALNILSVLIFIVFLFLGGVDHKEFVNILKTPALISIVKFITLVLKLLFVLIITYFLKVVVIRQKYVQVIQTFNYFLVPLSVGSFLVCLYELL